ncbi:MAG: CDP-alcohol phosphatidyltransferase family protein [Intestinimonas sp.]|jgi:CDP-diacylglycerol--glycerol-3-phosphate 3-phosphatidyltransferase|nr:CDP-alcohol phosphatidyltransferase family protein [Intestinimonas sp.]
MKKRLPNILTALRFPLALGLLPAEALSATFLVLYLLCCLTDALDGYFARRFGAYSDTGARLDSAADFLLVAVLIFKLWPVIMPGAGLALWIAGVALVRFAAALTARIRFGRLGFLHTFGNKLTGVLLALYPLALMLTQSRWVLLVILFAASLSAVEELFIELTAAEWDPNRAFLFKKK